MPAGPQLGQSAGQPLISIIVPVHNVARYLTECLDSVCEQSFTRLQVIAVDAASTDASGSILDARARRDPRLAVIHAAGPPGAESGPGRARNTGLRRATGDYVWFIDGDDSIRPGCLTAIAERILRDRPDVLLVDHEVLLRDGRVRTGYDHDLLTRDAKPFFALADRPDLIRVRMVSWNKIVRRDFLLGSGVTFLDRWPHEDVPFSAAVLMEARRISVLGSVCYRYRADRPGSAMRDGDRDRHFGVFDAWTQVLSRARQRNQSGDPVVTREMYLALFERAMDHCATTLNGGAAGAVLPGPRYVARRDRRRYFRLMHRTFEAFAPPGYQPPAGPRGVRLRLIQNDQYRRFLILTPLNKVRVWLRDVLRRLRADARLAGSTGCGVIGSCDGCQDSVRD